MNRWAATVDTTPDLVIRPRVASRWLPVGDRLELLVPRYERSIFTPLLRRFVEPDDYWVRYPLSVAASRIFQLINGRRSAEQVLAAYCWNYPRDTDQIESRVMSFLGQLEHHGFIDFSPR